VTDPEVLEFARTHRLDASDDDAIRSTFGSPVRFYQRLARVLEDAEAVALEPQLIYRLQRIRDRRTSARSARHLT
jgi:hypothetical protein